MNQELHNIIEELEKELHQPNTRKSKERLNELLAENFMEFGQSGNTYYKKDILERLPKSEEIRLQSSDFKTQKLSPEIVLITYRLQKSNMQSLRSSIWQKNNGQWQMLFHQGTLLQ